MDRVHVVIVGAGFGGLRVACGLQNTPVDVTVVDANNFHTFQPLLYQVATAGLDSDNVCFPVRGVVRRQHNTSVRLGTVVGVDIIAKVLRLSDGSKLTYDVLVLAAGSVSSSFGVPGVEEYTFPLKALSDALTLRNHYLSLVERANNAENPSEVDLGLVVVGGGPTGVETAGGMRELLDKVLAKDFRRLKLKETPVTLIEAADRVLGTFDPSLSDRARSTLVRRGISVRTGVGVARVERNAVVLNDGRRIGGGTIVWAAGVRANPIAELLGVELTKSGRIPVTDHLHLLDHADVFAIGDIASTPTADGRPLPQVAQPAIQGGVFVAKEISARLNGTTTTPFAYRDKGSMATIGRNAAVAEFPSGLKLGGFVGWVSWLGLHILYLMGFRNRANVLVNWGWNYLTYDRGSRLIVSVPSSSNE